MSEELEWELQDLFDSGLFAFPIWEHNAARQIVRTLMRRGVLREEVADAIEESTGDLDIWLSRRGKHMVGEWLIAWMNESREEYERYMEESSQPSRRHSMEHFLDNDSTSFHLDSDDEGKGPQGSTREEIQSVIDYLQLENNNSMSTEDNYAAPCLRSLGAPVFNNNGATSSTMHSQEALCLEMAAPPPLPPRKLSQKPSPEAECVKIEETPLTVFEQKAPICTLEEFNEPLYKHRDKDKITLLCSLFERRKLSDDSTDDQEQEASASPAKAPDTKGPTSPPTSESKAPNRAPLCEPESLSDESDRDSLHSGVVIYDSIPPVLQVNGKIPGNLTFNHDDLPNHVDIPQPPDPIMLNKNNGSFSKHSVHFDSAEAFLKEVIPPISDDRYLLTVSSPHCEECTCSINHYSLIHHSLDDTFDDEKCSMCKPSTNSKAMTLNFDTLDRDGPGFIYVMTDSYQKYLPWSGEHRYKVASSRQPEKCLTEFKSRNIEIDLIWQVKVQCHLRAIKEVHTCLQDFTIQSNWFKCPLSTIMDIISKIAKKYRSGDNNRHQ